MLEGGEGTLDMSWTISERLAVDFILVKIFTRTEC